MARYPAESCHRRWVHCGRDPIKGWTWTKILRWAVALNNAKLVPRDPKYTEKISPTPLHQPEQLKGRMILYTKF